MTPRLLRSPRRLLCASATATAKLTFTSTEPVTADAEKRQITGLVVPYGKPGRTSAGMITARKGGIRLPGDVTRVKLMNKHRPDGGEAVGHMLSVEDREDGIYATFQFGSGPLADAALTAAKEKTRDALSVELSEHVIQGGQLTASMLDAVALVDVPAFREAHVHTIASQQPGPVPSSLLVTPPAANLGTLSFADAARALFGYLSGDSSPEITAALADITTSTWQSQEGWLGELWSGLPFKRKFVPLLNSSRPLASLRMRGWRWTIRPQVGDWAGNKTEIPTNAVATEEVPYSANRLAGGHDIAREFYDFNDVEMITSYLMLMRDSYARKTDGKAITHIINEARPAYQADGTTPTTAADLIHAAAAAIEAVNSGDLGDQATLGDDAGLGDGAATFVVCNSADRMTLLDYTAQNVPAYIREMLDIDPLNFVGSAAVPAGTVIAGTRAANEFRELPGSPLRVNTVELARGGRDEALFGYWAAFNTDVRSIRSVTIAA